MPAQQLMVGYMGLSKQAGGAKGGAANSPATFGFGMTQGKVANVAITQAPDPITISGTSAVGRNAPSATRTDAAVDFSFTTLAYPRLVGLLCYGVAGAIASSGTGPYTHTITPALTVPYLASFGKMGTAPNYTKTTDCLIDDVVFSWDARTACQVQVGLKGLAIDPSASSFTVTNAEETTAYFTPPNALASYQLDVASATPAAAQVSAASIHIANNMKPVQLSKSIIDDDYIPGNQLMDGSITIIPNDFTDWQKVVAGSSGGHALSNVTVYGSFSLKVAIDASTDITFAAADKVAYTADLSDIDPTGGPMPLQLNFQALGASAPFTVTIHNSNVSY